MKKAIHLSDLHFEHQTWLSELRFQKDELKTFRNRLEEVVARWTNKDVLSKLEHYQNAFIRHNEVVDTLVHDLNSHESVLAKRAKENPVAIDHVHFEDHGELRNQVDTQRKLYQELKETFFRFLTETM